MLRGCTPNPRNGAATSIRDWARPDFECPLWRHRSAVTCHRDRDSGCSRAGKCGLKHKSSWRRLPSASLKSCWTDDPQTGEQLCQRSSCSIAKILGPSTDFPTWDSCKGPKTPQGIWLWRPVEFDYKISTGMGTETLGGHKQSFVWTKSQEKGAVTPQETEPDLPVSRQESLVKTWVSSCLLWGQGHQLQ